MGKVIRPYGSGGLLRILSYARSEASFLDAGAVFLRSASGEPHEYTVISVRPYKNIFLMRLDGLSLRDEIEKYTGAEILIRKETLTCEEDEYFWYELIGLEVYLDTGEYLGCISQIISSGHNDIYAVKKGDREVYVPATYEVVKEVDLEKKNMIISAMEGLLDLNEV